MLEKKSSHAQYRIKRKRREAEPVRILLLSLCCLLVSGLAAGAVHAAAANSRYSLEGAQYQLYTNSSCSKKAKDVNGDNAVLTTDANGSSNTLEMDPGTYYAKEITASKGYKKDTTVYTVNVTASETASFTSKEPPAYGLPDFRVYKTDTDGKFDEKRLEGAEFIVKYYDVATKSEIANASPDDWWKFKTVRKEAPESAPEGTYWAGFDWNKDTPIASSRSGSSQFYKDSDGNRILPLGWFTIEETKAPDGFKLTSKVYYGQIKQDGNGGDAVTNIEGAKDDSRLHAKVLIFEDKPCVTTIKKTDAESGEGLRGAVLQVLKGGTVIDEWTTGTGNHKIEALKAGSYTLREISAPYGYDISDDVQFTVKEGQDTSVGMKNEPVTVSTSAVDPETGKHIGRVDEYETITDSVHITGLHKGREYRVNGLLIDRISGEPIRDADGNEVTGETVFTATDETMEVTVDMTVDSTGFDAGGRTVAFETLSRTSPVHDEEMPVELQDHRDIDNADQTVVFPGISTEASDTVSGTHNLMAGTDASITDMVTYKGLLPGETYTLEGELYDKTEDRLTGITGTAELEAAEENGIETMEFRFDASGMEGHTLVVFETLKLDDVVLAEHRDADSEDQTIFIPKIETHAGLQNGGHEIKDIVSYDGLLADSHYVFRGWLVDTATGAKVPDSDGSMELLTGSETSGCIEIVLNTGKYDSMPGHSLTAFEELYLVVEAEPEEPEDAGETEAAESAETIETADTEGPDETEEIEYREILIAEHKDISDEAQTCEIYHDLKVQKKVTGSDGDRTGEFGFTASFSGLVPDTAYEMEGDDPKTFMSDLSGEASVPFSLTNNGEVMIRRLPKDAVYRIEETPSDHTASFKVYPEDMGQDGAIIIQAEGSNADDTEAALSTAAETVDMFDGTVVIAWENNKEKEPPEKPDIPGIPFTGDRSDLMLHAGMALAAASALAAMIRARRKKMDSEEKGERS